MFGTIRKHQKWIWLPVVFVIIFCFVIFFSPDMGGSGGGPSRDQAYLIAGKPVTISGRPVTATEVFESRAETLLAYFIRSGGREWPQDDDRLRQEAIYRTFLVQKMDDLGIHVSEKAVAQMARDRLGAYPYANFEKDILRPKGLTGDDFERFARHEAQIQQLVSVAALDAKLLTEAEADFIYRRENEEVVTDVALLISTNFHDQVTVTPLALGEFYTNSQARYRIPERRQISYVEFPVTNFFADADRKAAEVTNLNSQIEDYYFQQGTNSFKDTNGVVLSAEAAKAKLREEWRHGQAMRAARVKANEFGNELMSQPNPQQAENLSRLAAAKGLAVQVSPPFDRFKGLEDSALPVAISQAAFALTPQEPITFDPINGKDAVYVIAYKNTVPSELPSFEKIQDKVEAEYKEFEATKLARAAATNFYAVLTNGLAQKKTFTELASQEKVKVVAVPPFSPSTQSLTNLDEHIDLRRLQGMVADLKSGEVSPITPIRDGSQIVYLRDRLPIDEVKMKKELPDLMSRLRQYRQNEAFNQWFGKQAQAALVIPTPEAPVPTPGAPGGNRPR